MNIQERLEKRILNELYFSPKENERMERESQVRKVVNDSKASLEERINKLEKQMKLVMERLK